MAERKEWVTDLGNLPVPDDLLPMLDGPNAAEAAAILNRMAWERFGPKGIDQYGPPKVEKLDG